MAKSNYTRRTFLKEAGFVGIYAVVGGVVGSFLGKGYESKREGINELREFYFENQDAFAQGFQEEMAKRSQKLEKVVSGVVGKVKKPIGNYLEKVDEAPRQTLTITGAILGGGSRLIGGLPQYLLRRRIAKVRDENASQNQEIERLKEEIKLIKRGNAEQ